MPTPPPPHHVLTPFGRVDVDPRHPWVLLWLLHLLAQVDAVTGGRRRRCQVLRRQGGSLVHFNVGRGGGQFGQSAS